MSTLWVLTCLYLSVDDFLWILFINRLIARKRFTKFLFPTKTDQSLRSKILIQIAYYYFLTKFVDLLDTIFFVLRKKNNQITGLHVYHHTIVPLLGWSFMKLAPTVPSFQIFGILNSLVHVIMYSYYGLSSFGPSIQPYLWWKR